MNKRISVSVALAITIIAMTVTFAITWIVSMHSFNAIVSAVTHLQSQYAKLAEVDNYVRANFNGEIDDDYLFDRIIMGYMNGLRDKFSVYYTVEEYTQMVDIESGRLVGVGIEVIKDTEGQFQIAHVFADSPAAKAGVRSGGKIVNINGEDVTANTSLRDVQSRFWGEEGTELALKCVYGVAEEEEFAIRRSNYTAPTIESQVVNGYGYVHIRAFTQSSFVDFDYAIKQLQAENVKGIVFDVRGNSGGAFRYSFDMIDLLCPVGTVAKSVPLNGTVRVMATSDEEFVDLPMAVVVDANTSAAAELFAVSIRDLAGGQIVGVKTAGHYTIQSPPYRLQDGSAISVTTAVLYTGRDETLEGGILPDVEVPTDEKFADFYESYLFSPKPESDKQILRGMEVVRAMVRERGGDPGLAAPVPQAPPMPGSDVLSLPPDSSLPEEDPSSTSENTSTATP